MRDILYASFAEGSQAEKAVGALLDAGVKDEDISLVFNEKYSITDSGGRCSEEAPDVVENAKHGVTMTTGADAAVGAAKGAGLGLAIGALATLAALFIPGVGLVIGGGALATAVATSAGTTAAGAIAGGITGLLKDQGVAAEASDRYNKTITNGGALIAIALPSGEISQLSIRQILSKYEGADFSTYPLPNT